MFGENADVPASSTSSCVPFLLSTPLIPSSLSLSRVFCLMFLTPFNLNSAHLSSSLPFFLWPLWNDTFPLRGEQNTPAESHGIAKLRQGWGWRWTMGPKKKRGGGVSCLRQHLVVTNTDPCNLLDAAPLFERQNPSCGDRSNYLLSDTWCPQMGDIHNIHNIHLYMICLGYTTADRQDRRQHNRSRTNPT